jgi:hypothetical protein
MVVFITCALSHKILPDSPKYFTQMHFEIQHVDFLGENANLLIVHALSLSLVFSLDQQYIIMWNIYFYQLQVEL